MSVEAVTVMARSRGRCWVGAGVVGAGVGVVGVVGVGAGVVGPVSAWSASWSVSWSSARSSHLPTKPPNREKDKDPKSKVPPSEATKRSPVPVLFEFHPYDGLVEDQDGSRDP